MSGKNGRFAGKMTVLPEYFSESPPMEMPNKKQPPKKPEHKHRIPLWLRDEVLARDGYCCTYVSPKGVKCNCPVDLEIDHIVPFSLGGGTSLENLRVLCRTHNFLAEIEAFGEQFVGERIACG